MSEYRPVLERAGSHFRSPDLPLERILQGRDRRRRNQRIRAGVLGVTIAIGTAWLGLSVYQSTLQAPADQSRSPSPSPREERVPPASFDWDRVPSVRVAKDALVDIRTGEITPLPASITSFRPHSYAVAPGGEVLLFAARAGGPESQQIFVADVDGTNVRQLTDAPRGVSWGAWSPDGTTIVTLLDGIGSRGRGSDLVVIDVATGETTQLASGNWSDFWEPHFSADGQQILFGRFTKPEGEDTLGVPVGGGQAALVFEDRWNAIFSPDGRAIVYEASARVDNDGGLEVMLADADGSHPRLLVAGDEPFSNSPSWSPDGTRIVYTRHLLTRHGYRDRVAVVAVARRTPTFSVIAPQRAVWLDDHTLLVDVY